MEHHPMQHWTLIVARLFQVQVTAESYLPGTRVFQLRQRVKMGKFKVGLAFDGGSNPCAITKEYAARRNPKKIGFTVPVIGFGSPEPEMGGAVRGSPEDERQERGHHPGSSCGGHPQWPWRQMPREHSHKVPTVQERKILGLGSGWRTY